MFRESRRYARYYAAIMLMPAIYCHADIDIKHYIRYAIIDAIIFSYAAECYWLFFIRDLICR